MTQIDQLRAMLKSSETDFEEYTQSDNNLLLVVFDAEFLFDATGDLLEVN